MRAARPLLATLVLVLGLKLVLSAHWGLLADEAYYWVWSQHPAWGYYDQPPAIVALLLASSPLHRLDPELGVRAGAVLCTLGPALLGWQLPEIDRRRWLAWALGLPPLCWLTWMATSDAPLLLGWALCLWGAVRGGRAWLWAGLGAGLAVLSKYTGLAVLPLAVLASGDLRRPGPWLALGLLGLCWLPNLLWNAEHGGVSFAFQLQEGLTNPHPPGWRGPLQQLADQLGVVTPIAWVSGMAWALWAAPRALTDWTEPNRTLRIAWFTSAPLLLFFAASAWFGPPEAHWPAIAWLGVGLGLSHERCPPLLARTATVGALLGGLASLLLVAQAELALLPLAADPATRFGEGPALAAYAAELPEGPVHTERYQEAALLAFYTEREVRRQVECGREDQYGLWQPQTPIEPALYVRPRREGPPHCLAALQHYRRLEPFTGEDAQGRAVGSWDAFSLTVKP